MVRYPQSLSKTTRATRSLESQQGDSHGDVAAAEGSQVCDEVAPSQQADPHAAVAAAEQSQVGIEFAASQQADPLR